MKKIIFLLVSLSAYTVLAQDTLKIEKQKTLSVKSNLAVLLLRGFSLQVEYVLNKRSGLWAEVAHHCEEHSMFNSPLKETNFLMGLNCYSLLKDQEGTKAHNGMYFGPYLKYKQGFYCAEKELNYTAIFVGMQGGLQTLFKQNIVFNIGMGCGAGYFMKKQELEYTSLFERYHLPILDFRANVCLGYMF